MAVASVAEVKGAQAFLRYLGANWHDNQLIIAVVSWFRQESGSIKNVIGNNPFNIRPGVATKLASGVRKSKNGNGYFLIFPDLETGFRAAALVLKSLAPAYGYGLVIAAVKRGDAVDFLNALAMSSWDAAHYGYDGKNNSTNHLLQVYASFTGLQLPPPPKPKPKKKRPIFVRRDLNPPISTNNYIDGFASSSFYRARHHKIEPLD
jgi:hypothetical protein